MLREAQVQVSTGMLAVPFRDIEAQLRNSDPQKRQNTLRALTDLFLTAAPQLDEAGVEVFDSVFDVALEKPGVDALSDISVRMAPVPNAPTRLIRRLANDAEILVAGPVLSQSPRLSEDDLCEIARAKGNAHLLAISARRNLSTPVTDILIDRGDNDVARTVAGNETARLSEQGFTRLLKRAEGDEAISASVYARPDLPSDLVHNALATAAASSEENNERVAAAQRLAITLKQSGELNESRIAAFAAEKNYEDVIAAISLMSNLKFRYLENMMHGQRLGGLTLVGKSLGFSVTTMTALWKLAAARNGATTDEVQNARKDFLSVSRDVAQRVVRFWQVRQSTGLH
jgi:uncharacterized protein (DUF2336 family)